MYSAVSGQRLSQANAGKHSDLTHRRCDSLKRNQGGIGQHVNSRDDITEKKDGFAQSLTLCPEIPVASPRDRHYSCSVYLSFGVSLNLECV